MIQVDTSQQITTIRLANGKVNALDIELLQALEGKLEYLASSQDTRALIITGKGKTFSAGVDLSRILCEDTSYVEKFLQLLCSIFTKLFLFPKPTVAAINGHAIAGGCVLALTCDYRLMANNEAKIGMPGISVGLPFPAVVIEILRFTLPLDKVRQLIYTGAVWSAAEAQRHSLIDEAVPAEKLLELAQQLATKLVGLPSEAFILTKQSLRRPVAARLQDPSSEEIQLWTSELTRARIATYLENKAKK